MLIAATTADRATGIAVIDSWRTSQNAAFCLRTLPPPTTRITPHHLLLHLVDSTENRVR